MNSRARKLWNDVLETPGLHLVGGEIEFLEGEETFRGPIEEIRMTGSGLFVKMEFVIQLEYDSDGEDDWTLYRDVCPSLLITNLPELCHGLIQFGLPTGWGCIFPRGTTSITRGLNIRLAA